MCEVLRATCLCALPRAPQNASPRADGRGAGVRPVQRRQAGEGLRQERQRPERPAPGMQGVHEGALWRCDAPVRVAKSVSML